MRIIAGQYKNRNIKTLEGHDVRPTSNRVRENIFNLAGQYFHDQQILDLFSGSGAIGLEFLSRYASYVHFNDQSKSSLEIIKSNIENLHVPADLYSLSNTNHLSFLNSTPATFDIIFLDPPYNKVDFREILDTIASRKLLNPSGLIIIESPTNQEININDWVIYKERKYGNTKITIIEEK